MSGKSRLWCFTNFDIKFDYNSYFDNSNGNVKYILYGLEICPDTGKQHHQGLIYFKNPRASIKSVASELGSCHVEMCKGNLDDNIKYCSKDNNITEIGDKPNQGKRIDLDKIKNEIFNGTNVEKLIIDNPLLYHQYGRTLNKLEDIALRKKFRSWMTEGIWLHGPSGVGKSHLAFLNYHPDTHYILPNDNGWWDGYTGQENVIINEFRAGTMHFCELLDLVDKWPKTVKRRNREPAPFLAKKLIITSPEHPSQVYFNLSQYDKLDQLYRRFDIHHIENSNVASVLEQKWSTGNTGN